MVVLQTNSQILPYSQPCLVVLLVGVVFVVLEQLAVVHCLEMERPFYFSSVNHIECIYTCMQYPTCRNLLDRSNKAI